MKKLSLAFVAAFVLAGCAHHGSTSATAAKDCCANKKGEAAMAEGKTCEHDMTTAEGKAACDHEKDETAAAVVSPTPAPH